MVPHLPLKLASIGVVLMTFLSTSMVHAENKLTMGKIAFDLPTAHTLSIVVPTASCDDNRNGTISVFYREAGKGDWKESIGLFRNRNGKGTSQPFAGMLFDLKQDTDYEVKVVAKDPDGVGGEAEQIAKKRTRKIPARIKATAANTKNVANLAELNAAVAAAKPGTVILMKKGIYKGSLGVKGKKGSAASPIVIRGEDMSGCIISGRISINGCKHIHIENMTIQGNDTGIALSKTDSITIRDNLILRINKGIYAKGGHRSLYIANNVIIGNNVIGDKSRATWNDEGIVLSGEGHELIHNTLAGFGDSIGMTHRTAIKNRAIDMHRNLIIWGGDDGVEMDFTHRNGQAHHNLFVNSTNGTSCQMVWNGPAYIFKNVMYNVFRGPYKIKPERAPNDGVYIFNNTTVKSGQAILNYSTAVDGLVIMNNLVVGTKSKQALYLGKHGAGIQNLTMDYNAWSYDGSFSVAGHGNAGNFNAWKTKHKQGNHDILLAGQKIFKTLTLDFDKNKWNVWRTPHHDYSLDPTSKAIDAAKIIPGINDNFKGKGPDIGALESGEEPPSYGAFPKDTTPPSVPTNVKATRTVPTQVDLVWDASIDADSGVAFYRIYRDGKRIGQAIGQKKFSDKAPTEGTAHSYEISAMNGRTLESKKSQAVKGPAK